MKPLRALAGACAALAFAGGALAQAEYPSKPIRVVVPWPPGGLVDIAGRLVGEKLQASLGQPIIVENRAGGGGTIGADAVAKAAPDGHTLLLSTSALTMNEALRPGKLPFDLHSALAPVALVARAPSVVVVHPSSGVASLQELIARARANPGKLTYGSAGNGTPAHLSGELFKAMLGLDIVHVPYKGAPPAMTDQIAGRIDFHFANAGVALSQIRAGKVRALAVTSAQRSDMMLNLPTMGEAGVPNFEADQWIGYFAPAAAPRAALERLAAEANRALALPEVRSALEKNGMLADGRSTPRGFGALLKEDQAKWSALVRRANIKPD